ncbi:MAG: hypothetical protein KBF83_14645 [Pyrinomonadaceae bacterium]|nr:hypothetical protein [Pyrinomonadaceae bacterium]MBP9110791.1 hypothetical protein [Pyrinomonadaceae bacterium]
MMKIRCLFFLPALIVITALTVSAQKGTAEPGYYPSGYGGDIWTGEVTAVNSESRELTLTYRKGSKEETFVAVVPKGFSLPTRDGKQKVVPIADLIGWRITVYYMSKSRKDENGVKIKYAEVFNIKMLSQNK